MITRVTLSKTPNFKLKNKSSLWLLVGYPLITRLLPVGIKRSQALVPNKSSVMHRITLIGHVYCPQYMKEHKLGIKTLKNVLCSPNVF